MAQGSHLIVLCIHKMNLVNLNPIYSRPSIDKVNDNLMTELNCAICGYYNKHDARCCPCCGTKIWQQSRQDDSDGVYVVSIAALVYTGFMCFVFFPVQSLPFIFFGATGILLRHKIRKSNMLSDSSKQPLLNQLAKALDDSKRTKSRYASMEEAKRMAVLLDGKESPHRVISEESLTILKREGNEADVQTIKLMILLLLNRYEWLTSLPILSLKVTQQPHQELVDKSIRTTNRLILRIVQSPFLEEYEAAELLDEAGELK